MHIVRVAEQFPPAPGGLAPGMLALSLAQHNRGHHITVITRDAEGASQVDGALPFSVVRVAADRLLSFGLKAAKCLRNMPELPDIVHCHGPAAAPILFLRRKVDPPVVLSLHAVRRYQYGLFRDLAQMAATVSEQIGAELINPPSGFQPWSSHVLKELILERYMCKRADHLALVAEYFGPQLQEYFGIGPNKYTVTYNGSDLSLLKQRQVESSRLELGPEDQYRVILYIGRLDWVKRAHLLVQALPAVLKREPHTRLLLVGDGDQRPDLEALVAAMGLGAHVTMPGWLPHDQVQQLYGCAECLCLPSYWEGLAKVLLEAMSMGIPVIASDIPANRELLRGGNIGYLIDKPNAAQWAAALVSLLADSQEAQERAKRAGTLVDDMYRWHHVAERLDGAYQKATYGQKPAGEIEGAR